MQRIKSKAISALVLIALAGVYFYLDNKQKATDANSNAPVITTPNAHQTIAHYFNQQVSGKMITLNAEVIKLLSDDLHEPRHQRFIIQLDNNLTVLISHNIDLAPRIEGLNAGDLVTITGQYEWNPKGGVIHWTHHDPQGNRDGGQIIHQGKTYR